MLASMAALSAFALAQPANALTMKQCSEKYKTANDAGAVGSMNWKDFRKAECGEGASMALTKVKAEKVKAEKVKTEKVKTEKVKTEPTTAAAGPSMQECSASYKTAKDAGTLGGMTWNEFRKAGCVAKTAAAPQPAAKKPATKKEAAAPAETTTTVTQRECSTRYQAAKSAGTLGAMTWNEFRSAGCPTTIARKSGSMLPTMGSIFPSSIAKKYAGQKAGKARMLTCRDQYRANKAAGITAPKWTEEGGGYYSECNKRLSQH
jgi:hypothetical protein